MGKKSSGLKKASKPMPPGLVTGLQEMGELVKAKTWELAYERVQLLVARYGKRRELLLFLLALTQVLGKAKEMIEVSEELVRMDPEALRGPGSLTSAYLQAGEFCSALLLIRDNPQIAEALNLGRMEMDLLVSRLKLTPEGYAERGLPAENGLELLAQFEAAHRHSYWGRGKEAIIGFTAITRQAPMFAEVWFQLAQEHNRQGQFAEGRLKAEKALEIKPDYFEARLELVNSGWFLGDMPAARAAATGLSGVVTDNVNGLISIVRAYVLLGDVTSILELHRGNPFSAKSIEKDPDKYAHFFLVVGTAAHRSGNLELARELWMRASQLEPDSNEPELFLDELDAGPRSFYPPFFRLAAWFESSGPAEKFASLWDHRNQNFSAVATNSLKNWLNARSNTLALFAGILEFGSDEDRELAVNWCEVLRRPDLGKLLAEFALSLHGSNPIRLVAACTCHKEGWLPEEIQFWWHDRFLPVRFTSFEVSYTADKKMDRRVAPYLAKADMAYTQGRLAEAEKICRSALELYGLDPAVGSNLASIMMAQNKTAEAETLLRQTLEANPDYYLGHLNHVTMLVNSRRFREAEEALRELGVKPRFTHSEAIGWLQVQYRLAVWKKNPAQALAHLHQWGKVDPRNSRLSRMIVDAMDCP